MFAEHLPHPDGTIHDYLSTKFPLLDDKGRVYAVAGVSTDVTELSTERQAHAEAEQRWRALLETSASGVLVIANDGRVAYANQQALRLLGATEAQLLGRSVLDFAAEGDEGGSSAELFTALARAPGPTPAQRWRLRQLGGRVIPIEVTLSAITYAGQRSRPSSGTCPRRTPPRRRCESPNAGSVPCSKPPRSVPRSACPTAPWSR